MDFSDALRAVKDGKRIRRPLWRELGGRIASWVELSRPGPDGNGLQLGAVLVCPVPGNGGTVLFACSQWDVLAEDWELVPDGEA